VTVSHRRFVVVCVDEDGAVLEIGETDDPTGGVLVDVVKRHPAWRDPTVLERKSRQAVLSVPDAWPFPTGDK
jgi:hypothetical protein